MEDFCVGIIGNDFDITTKFIDKIIQNTNVKTDQEHIKMNIIINNKLLNNNDKEILNLISNLEKINSTCLCLCFDNYKVYELIKKNANIPILNSKFKNNENMLIQNIIDKHKLGSVTK